MTKRLKMTTVKEVFLPVELQHLAEFYTNAFPKIWSGVIANVRVYDDSGG